jgi:hypothetical protein
MSDFHCDDLVLPAGMRIRTAQKKQVRKRNFLTCFYLSDFRNVAAS